MNGFLKFLRKAFGAGGSCCGDLRIEPVEETQEKERCCSNRRRDESSKGSPRPEGLLFLCVANSARSQMAEGIARSLLPAGTRIWSAGSRPTSIRPEAIKVLREIGIDISSQAAKPISAVPTDEIGTVITLCAEQECPLFPGKVERLHWELSDPAAAEGSESDILNAFRQIRDDLRGRITALLPNS